MIKKEVAESLLLRLRSLIFGIEDGIISIWGLVLGVSVGTHDSFTVILAGLAGAIPAALSMAAGDYLSSKSQREVQESKISQAEVKINEDKKVVLESLRRKYIHEGFSAKDINPWMSRLSRNDKLLLRKYEEENGIIPDHFDNPLKNALTILVAFLVGSLIPLVPFFLLDIWTAQITSLSIAIVALFIVGAVKTKFTEKVWWKSGLEMLIVGLAAAVVGFAIGKVLGG